MEQTNRKLAKITSAAMIAVGVSTFIAYLLFIVAPALFPVANAPNLGLILYGLATAGSAFVCWGLILGRADDAGLDRASILKATGIGIAMLALMRLGVAIFPHAPFDQIRYLPIVESVLFGLVALTFLRG